MKYLGLKTKEIVKTARPVRIHKGTFKEQKTYNLLSAMDLIKYINWMCNPANEFNCKECKENYGSTRRLPCGQQNCWVSCHIGRV